MTVEPTASAVPGAARAAAAGAAWDGELNAVRLRFGAGRLGELGEAAAGMGWRRVLLVSDPGLARAGHSGSAERSLSDAGIEVARFDEVSENPSSDEVAAGAAAAAGRAPQALVAVGGGSVMDAAKGINFLLTNGGSMEDYWGWGKARRPLLPSLAVPTTAGTGSDAQSYAVISRSGSGRKMACGAPGARFGTVVLDPELLASAPRPVRAAAGIDALSHALESYVTRRRTPISAMLAREAWRWLDGGFEAVLEGTAGVEVLGRQLLGSHLAGAAIEASMLGAAHAAANPLTAGFGVVHGAALGLVLPAVLRFNAAVAEGLYRELAAGGSAELAERIESLRRRSGLPGTLQAAGVDRRALPEMARQASAEWTGSFNPRPVSEEDFLELYESIP